MPNRILQARPIPYRNVGVGVMISSAANRRGLVGVGAHLPDPAGTSRPGAGGPTLGGRVVGPGRAPVLPAIEGPVLSGWRPRTHRPAQRGLIGSPGLPALRSLRSRQ